MPVPPAHIAPFVEVLGDEVALTFFLTFGGAELVYSITPRRSRLVEVIGADAARALAEHDRQRGLPRRVPLANAWCAQLQFEKGLSVAEIARRMHASDVTVRRWLKQGNNHRATDPRQTSLF